MWEIEGRIVYLFSISWDITPILQGDAVILSTWMDRTYPIMLSERCVDWWHHEWIVSWVMVMIIIVEMVGEVGAM